MPSSTAHTWRGLYAIVDPAFCRGRDPLWVASAILEGGCGVLQLRGKQLASSELELLAQKLCALCRGRGVPFVVNDCVELALRVGADGVHLGQTDLPIEAARALAGNALAIGLSTHDLAQAQAAAARGADLIGFGPVFATASKLDPDPVTGVPALRTVGEALQIPVVAIGGVTPENAAHVASAGVQMAAAISALCAADDPSAVARVMHRVLVRSAGTKR